MGKRKKGRSKKPKHAAIPRPVKKPAVHAEPADPKTVNPLWSFREFDDYGEWSSGQQRPAPFRKIAGKLKSFEHMTVSMVRSNSHKHRVQGFCPDAQERLRQLRREDYGELWSLHLTGKQRLWGVWDRNTFSVIWWDPEHKVYPVKRRGT